MGGRAIGQSWSVCTLISSDIPCYFPNSICLKEVSKSKPVQEQGIIRGREYQEAGLVGGRVRGWFSGDTTTYFSKSYFFSFLIHILFDDKLLSVVNCYFHSYLSILECGVFRK